MSTDCAWADPGHEELKPCPFCGGEAEIIVVASYYKVRCSRCSGSATIATDRAAAVEFWNRRAGFGPDWVELHDNISKGMAELNAQCRRAMAQFSENIRAAMQRGEE